MISKDAINQIVNSNEHAAGKAFAFAVQGLILVSLVTFSIDTLPNLSESMQGILNGIEMATVAIFTLEYVLRLLVAESKAKFIFSFYGLVDLAAGNRWHPSLVNQLSLFTLPGTTAIPARNQ
ncbi:hypothetical protein PDESU_05368 [Pontiella desulfatans]|uniref:Ion transport domain-containing protein n=1 Tax=Pontiella desulfatans TaxID=2750659 RepID=A0A6C2UBY2_PONDE|nr:ion transporter [Pontiella desulfatans]VGO16776.1 hypothetical protein PDESU_05368 [Pontiella desulfatans]